MTISSSLLNNPVFNSALAEIEGLGFRVFHRSVPGARPYGIIGGRSNERWWLVPLDDSRLTVSGLALFQPIVSSAKLLKRVAVIVSKLGLSSAFLSERVYISGGSNLEDIFHEGSLRYAFFTGTDSPHRKVAVQIMGRNGVIKGFAKVSKNAAVKPLLKHEAKTLNYLKSLKLQTALIPTVLFCGEIDEVEALVTDSLKTAKTRTVTALKKTHISFLQELAEKTAVIAKASDVPFLTGLRERYAAVAETLTYEWHQRLGKALELLENSGSDLETQGLIHGDFTPWNSFFVNDRLYVFDWEYASGGYPVGHDLIHYTLSLPVVSRQTVSETIKQLEKVLRETIFSSESATSDDLLLSYLCAQSIRNIFREPLVDGIVVPWDGEQNFAVFIDEILNRRTV